MATTAIWPIRGRLDRAIAYIKDQEKTYNPAWEQRGFPALSSLMLGQSRPELAANENPTTARRTAPPPSGRTSGSKGSTGRDIERRPSVRQAIRELQAERTAKETQLKKPTGYARPHV